MRHLQILGLETREDLIRRSRRPAVPPFIDAPAQLLELQLATPLFARVAKRPLFTFSSMKCLKRSPSA
jgi:hypothetical protein